MKILQLIVAAIISFTTAALALAQPVAEKNKDAECALYRGYYESFVKDAIVAVRSKNIDAAQGMLGYAADLFKRSCLKERSEAHVDAAKGYIRLLMDSHVAYSKLRMHAGKAGAALDELRRVQELFWQTEIEPPVGMMDEFFRGLDAGVASGKVSFEDAAMAEKGACRMVSSPPFVSSDRFPDTTPYTAPERCKKYPKEQ